LGGAVRRTLGGHGRRPPAGGQRIAAELARRERSDRHEIRSDRAQSDAFASEADGLGLLIGRVISDRVEVADDRDGSLVRFVFGRERADPRQRIISAASELFRANGVRTTGVNTVIAHAGVAKATFYANFQSKDDLIRLWLASPAARWFDQVVAEVEARTDTPAERLTTFFDVLGDWLTADDFRGCPFLNTATEFRNADHAFAQELADLTREVEQYFRGTAAEAGFSDPDGIAEQLFLLVPGTITTSSARASAEPARVARAAAAGLVAAATRG
jgi:AcrR family transcriptional regulator